MSSIKDQVIDEQNAQQPAPPAKGGSPAFLKELQDKGSVTLKAMSRDELAAMVGQIPADIHYGSGAVGFNCETCEYMVQLDLTQK